MRLRSFLGAAAQLVRRIATGIDPLLSQLRLDIVYRANGAYLDWGEYQVIGNSPDLRFDSGGLPEIFREGDWHHSPVTVAQYGLQEHARALQHEPGSPHAANARAVAEWLVKNQDDGTGVWYYRFPFPVAGMDVTLASPWSSGMAQGQAISVLTRAYQLSGDARFIDSANKATDSLERRVQEGGLLARFNGAPVYEEFPTLPPSFALNGFLFTLLGLYDLAATDETSRGRELFAAGMRSLASMLPYYDVGGVSAYHLGHLTSPPRRVHRSLYYHYIHIQLLGALNSVAPTPELGEYRAKWLTHRPRRWDPR